MTPSIGWRPELAGLRGLAIILVVLSHVGLPVVNGGGVGVTMFFALSGFLITSLLVAEADRTGSVDLRRFFVRRVRRLAPALLVAVTVVFVIAAAAGRASAVERNSLLAITYVANWARAQGDLMGMWNHAWSLAIEEQFYLVWPIAFLLVIRRVRPTSALVIGGLLVVAAASAILRGGLELDGASSERLYFGSDTRAEALLLGCALACLIRRGQTVRLPRFAERLPRFAGPVALLVIVVLAATDVSSRLWPGALYTLAAIATCLLILAVLTSRSWLLASRPMVWIGERSYSLYLWHVPVVLFLIGPLDGVPPVLRIGAMVGISLALATVSYELVEQPFRRGTLRLDRPVPVPGTLAIRRSG